MISKEDIKKLATLARITVSEQEAAGLAEDAEAILGYVSQIGDTAVTEDGDAHTTLTNVMRNDGEPHEPGVFTEAILSQAPHRDEEYVVVRKVITKE